MVVVCVVFDEVPTSVGRHWISFSSVSPTLTPRGPSLTVMRPLLRIWLICAAVRSDRENGWDALNGSAVATGAETGALAANGWKTRIQITRLSSTAPTPPAMQSAVITRCCFFICCSFLRLWAIGIPPLLIEPEHYSILCIPCATAGRIRSVNLWKC